MAQVVDHLGKKKDVKATAKAAAETAKAQKKNKKTSTEETEKRRTDPRTAASFAMNENEIDDDFENWYNDGESGTKVQLTLEEANKFSELFDKYKNDRQALGELFNAYSANPSYGKEQPRLTDLYDRISDLTDTANELKYYATLTSDDFGDDYKGFIDWLNGDAETFGMMKGDVDSFYRYYTQWGSKQEKDDYDKAVAAQKAEEEKWETFSTEDAQKELADLEAAKKEYNAAMAGAAATEWQDNGDEAKTRAEQILSDAGVSSAQELDAKIKATRGDISNYHERSASKRVQGWVNEFNDDHYAPFYIHEGENIVNSRTEDSFLADVHSDSALTTFFRSLQSRGTFSRDVEDPTQFKQYATEDEWYTYEYLLGKERKGEVPQGTSDDYLRDLESALNQRQAEAEYERFSNKYDSLPVIKHAAEELFSLAAGVEGYLHNVNDLFVGLTTDRDYLPPSATQRLSSMYLEDLNEVGPKAWGWLGGRDEDGKPLRSFAGVLYELGVNIGNMAIPTAAGMATAAIGLPGSWVNAALVGTGAAGGAYADMINAGYSKQQALGYATLTGISEVALEKVLNGIPGLGDKNLFSVIADKLKNGAFGLDNALARVALKFSSYLARMTPEMVEEGLQTVLAPCFQLMFTGDWEGVNWEEVSYSFFLGGLCAGPFIFFDSQRETVNYRLRANKAISEGNVDEIIAIGREVIQNDRVKEYLAEWGEFRANNPDLVEQGNAMLNQTRTTKGGSEVLTREAKSNRSGMVTKLADTLRMIDSADTNARVVSDISETLRENGVADADIKKAANIVFNMIDRGTYTMKPSERAFVERIGAEDAVDAALRAATDVNSETRAYIDRIRQFKGLSAYNGIDWQKIDEQKEQRRQQQETDAQRAKEAAEQRFRNVFGVSSGLVQNYVDKENGVEIVKFSDADGEFSVETSDGKTHTVGDAELRYKDETQSLIATSLAASDADVSTANAIYRTAIMAAEHGNVSLGEAFRQTMAAYNAGKTGNRAVQTPALSADMRSYVYNLGSKRAEQTIRAAQDGTLGGRQQQPGGKTKKGTVDFIGKAKNRGLSNRQKVGVRVAGMIASSVTHGNVHFFSSSKGEDGNRYHDDAIAAIGVTAGSYAENGYYDKRTGDIYIDLDAGNRSQGVILWTLGHELTHFIAQNAQDQFRALAEFLSETYGDLYSEGKSKMTVDQMIERKQEIEREAGRMLSYEDAFEEVVADGMQRMLGDADLLKKVINLATRDSGLAGKIQGWLAKTAVQVYNEYQKLKPDTEEARLLLDESVKIDQIAQTFAEGLAVAGNNFSKKEFASGEPTNDASSEVMFSRKLDAELMEAAINANKGAVDTDLLDTVRQQRMEIKQLLQDAEYDSKTGERKLVLPPDVTGKAFVWNRSYGRSMENTTICPRSIGFDALVDMIGRKIGRPLTRMMALAVSQNIGMLTPEIQCQYCYVAADRMAYREYVGKFIEERDTLMEKLRSGEIKTVEQFAEALRELRGAKKVSGQIRKAAEYYVRAFKDGTALIDAAEVADLINNDERLKKIRSRLSANGKNATYGKNDELSFIASYAQSASYAKKWISYEAYGGTILGWSDAVIKKLNNQFGLRFYSFSDFSPAFILENMQMVTDAAVRGLKGLAYTKDLDFVRIFAPTRMNINVSVFGQMKNGIMAEDDMQGANWEETKKLREKYPNVGATFVATSDDAVRWALKQDWIDVVIPYHTVKAGELMTKFFGFKDFKASQEDVIVGSKAKKDRAGLQSSIYPEQHQNKLDTYLAELEKNRLSPRFPQFLEEDRENYMKLVNETRRRAGETPAMRPVFNMRAARKAIAKMEKSGGYYKPIGGSDQAMELFADMMSDKLGQTSVDDLTGLRIDTEEFGRRLTEMADEFDGGVPSSVKKSPRVTIDSQIEAARDAGSQDINRYNYSSLEEIDRRIKDLNDYLARIRENKDALERDVENDKRVKDAKQAMWDAEDSGDRGAAFRAKVEYRRTKKTVTEELSSGQSFISEDEITKEIKRLNVLRADFVGVEDLTESDYAKLVDHFGTTNDFDVAGFILKDGSVLDFSGKKQYGKQYAGGRDIYHNEVGDVVDKAGNTSPRINMVNNGNIRLVPEINGINLSVKPSKEQLNALRAFIRYNDGDVHVDIDDRAGNTVETLSYWKGASPDRIITDINTYFDTGEVPQRNDSDLLKFISSHRDIRRSTRPKMEYEGSDRELLANALESAALTDGERRMLRNYKGQIAERDAQEQRLRAAEKALTEVRSLLKKKKTGEARAAAEAMIQGSDVVPSVAEMKKAYEKILSTKGTAFDDAAKTLRGKFIDLLTGRATIEEFNELLVRAVQSDLKQAGELVDLSDRGYKEMIRDRAKGKISIPRDEWTILIDHYGSVKELRRALMKRGIFIEKNGISIDKWYQQFTYEEDTGMPETTDPVQQLENVFSVLDSPDEDWRAENYSDEQIAEMSGEIVSDVLSYLLEHTDVDAIRDKDLNKLVSALQQSADAEAERLSAYDQKLLNLEAATPLKEVLKTERQRVRETERGRAKAKQEAAVAKERERVETKERAKAEREKKAAVKEAVKEAVKTTKTEVRTEERQRADKRVEEEKEKSKKKLEHLREQREAAQIRGKIKKLRADLAARLLKGRNNKSVPAELFYAAKAVLDVVDVTGRNTLYRVRIGKNGERVMVSTNPDKYTQEQLNEGLRQGKLVWEHSGPGKKTGQKDASLKERLKKLQNVYDSLEEHNEKHGNELERRYGDDRRDEWANGWNAQMSQWISELIDSVDETPVMNMSVDQLNDVYMAIRGIVTVIQNANKQIFGEQRINNAIAVGAQMRQFDSIKERRNRNSAVQADDFRYKNVSAAAKKAVQESGRETLAKAVNAATNVRITLFGSAIRAIREMTDFDEDAPLARCFKAIEDGLIMRDEFIMECDNILQRVRQTREDRQAYADACQTPLAGVTLTDLNGNEFQITMMQAIQYYLTYLREKSNADHKHLQGETIFPDYDALRRGNYEEAYSEEKRHSIGPLSEEQLAAISTAIESDEWAKRYMEAAQEILYNKASTAINQVSMIMYGVPIATEENYIPYVVDKNFIARENENVTFDASLTGIGMLKSTVSSTKPLIMYGMNEVLDRHIQDVAKIYGLMIPVRNVNMLLNGFLRKADSATDRVRPLRQALTDAWGEYALELVEKAIADVQAPRADKDAKLVRKFVSAITGRAVASTLSGNVSVAIKQVASYFSAGVYLDPIALGAGNAYWQHFVRRGYAQSVFDEIDAHTPVHYMRRQGNGLPELGDLNQGGKYTRFKENHPWLSRISPFGWIQANDVNTTAALWIACKNQVKRQKGMTVGSDAYWEAVTKLYEKVIGDTQPMYDPLHRAEITKSKQLKMVVMFQTQPIQNAGILREAGRKMIVMRQKYGKDSDRAKAARTEYVRAVTSQVAAAVTFTALTLVAKALRHRMDDFRDKETGDLTVLSVSQEFAYLTAQNILSNAVPVIGSIAWSAAERITGKNKNDVLNDYFVDTINSLWDAFSKLADPSAEDVRKLLMKVADMFGFPATNLWSFVYGGYQNVLDIIDGEFLKFTIGVEKTNKQKVQELYNAIVNETVVPDKIRKNWKKNDDYLSAVAAGIRTNERDLMIAAVQCKNENNIPGAQKIAEKLVEKMVALHGDNFAEAAAKEAIDKEIEWYGGRLDALSDAKKDGDTATYKKILKQLTDAGYDADEAEAAVADVETDTSPAWWQTGKNPTSTKMWYKTSDIRAVVSTGDDASMRAMYDTMVDDYRNRGKESPEKEANKAIRAGIKSEYQAQNIDYATANRLLKDYGGFDSDEAYWALDEWGYTGEKYVKYVRFFDAIEAGTKTETIVDEYYEHGVTQKGIVQAITKRYHELYSNARNADEKELVMDQALAAYRAVGYKNDYQNANAIKKWDS